MYYHSYKKSLAIKMWKKTLAEDPNNINALQDLATAYGKLRNSKEANHHEKLLQKALEEATPDERKLMHARSQVEQAYALFWDLHTESWSGIGLRKKQVQTYEAALRIAGDLMDRMDLQKEKRDWLLYTGQAHERLCHAYFRAGEQTLYLESMGKAIQYLDDCLQLSSEEDAYKAEIWYIMGNALAHSSSFQVQDESIKTIINKYAAFWKDPCKCYHRALEYDSSNIWVLGRIGINLSKQNKLDDSLKWLDRAIKTANNLPGDNPLRKSCWNALHHRAKVYIKKAKYEVRNNPYLARGHLIKAKKDSALAVAYNFNPSVLAVAGEVHTLLANNPLTDEAEKEHLRDTALEKFYEASIFQDGLSICDTHLKWARCLKDKGDMPSAIESYKIAFDTASDTSGNFLVSLASELLCAMLQNYADLKHPVALIKEVAFWFIYIDRLCSQRPFSFAKLPWLYAREVLDILEYIVKHAPDLTSKVQDVSSVMLKKILDKDMAQWMSNKKFKSVLRGPKYDMFKEKLDEITNLNTCNINNPPQRPPTLPSEPEPSDDNVGFRQPLHDGVAYDFCVIYDTKNPDIEGWVENSLLTGLEIDFFGLKGYYPKRSKLGTLYFTQWGRVIKDSAKTLVVLSHGFDADEDLPTEMAQHLEQKEMIVIQREHVEVPTKLRGYLKLDFTVQPNIPELARHLLPVKSQQLSLFM